jgi:DedD protein
VGSRVHVAALLLCIATSRLGAQQPTDSVTTMRAEDVLTRVRRYATIDVALARTLADSLVRALPADATVIPQALFARASIAASAADAERDYGRIVNEYRFSSRVPDALMRLAVLESARNNRAAALRHLDRLLREHGDAPARSRASLLAGRLRMEGNDPARGCELLAAAFASAGALERDVRDQAVSLGASCPTPIATAAERAATPMGVVRGQPSDAVPASPPAGAAPSSPRRPTRVAGPRRDSTQRDTTMRRDTVSRATRTAAPSVAKTTEVRAPAAPMPSARQPATPAPVVAAPAVTRPAPTTPSPAPAVTKPVDAAPTPASGARFAVQFAAYNDRPGAEGYAALLRGRGITARVEGSTAPFRVRAGRFASRQEAEAAAVLWRRPGQATVVVSIGTTP